MNAILYTTDESVRGYLVSKLLFMGIYVYSVNSFDKIDPILDSNDIECLLLDIDNNLNEYELYIDMIKNNKNAKNVYIVILSSKSNEEKLIPFIEYGINAIFFKEQSFTSYLKRIIPNLYRLEKEYEKRRYERIFPTEDITISFNLSKNKVLNTYEGKLIDLSVAGAAIKLTEEVNLIQLLEHDTYIPNFEMYLENKLFQCDGIVTRKFDDKVVIKYVKTSSMFKSGISSYILKKMYL